MKKSRTGSMLSRDWVERTRHYFLHFLQETHFPEFVRHGEHGLRFAYPEWLIMLIGVLAVKCKIKTYVGIHRLSTQYWKELCGEEVKVPPISESTPGRFVAFVNARMRAMTLSAASMSTPARR